MSRYVVGLTGGIAAGKSEVTRRFEALGIVVADADLAARLMAEHLVEIQDNLDLQSPEAAPLDLLSILKRQPSQRGV